MADNNSINIGGVRFNQQDVKKSEVVKQGDKQMNSVFLNDGTHVVYPDQNPKNDASIMQQNGKKYTWELNPRGNNATFVSVANEDSSYKETTFNKVDGAQITGTEGRDDYRLKGCKDTNVDISQNDGVKDNVEIGKYKAKGEETRTSSGVTVEKATGDKVKEHQEKVK